MVRFSPSPERKARSAGRKPLWSSFPEQPPLAADVPRAQRLHARRRDRFAELIEYAAFDRTAWQQRKMDIVGDLALAQGHAEAGIADHLLAVVEADEPISVCGKLELARG